MAFSRVDRARMTSTTTGTGDLTLTAAVGDGQRGYFRTFAAAGVADGDQLHYLILDGANWEIGFGEYSSTGPTLVRGDIIASSAGGAAINCTGNQDVSVVMSAVDFKQLSGRGSDMASAANVTLGDGSFFHITGTTTITDIDFDKPWNGRMAMLVFDAALTLTHNATTLRLPGNANIQTAAGDRAIIVQDNDENIIVVAYIKAAGLTKSDVGLGNVDNSSTATLLDAIAGRVRGRNAQTGTTYSFQTSDIGKLVTGNNAAAQTFTLNTGILTADQHVINVAELGAGQLSIAAGAGMTIRSDSGKLKVRTQYVAAALVYIGTNEALFWGDIVS